MRNCEKCGAQVAPGAVCSCQAGNRPAPPPPPPPGGMAPPPPPPVGNPSAMGGGMAPPPPPPVRNPSAMGGGMAPPPPPPVGNPSAMGGGMAPPPPPPVGNPSAMGGGMAPPPPPPVGNPSAMGGGMAPPPPPPVGNPSAMGGGMVPPSPIGGQQQGMYGQQQQGMHGQQQGMHGQQQGMHGQQQGMYNQQQQGMYNQQQQGMYNQQNMYQQQPKLIKMCLQCGSFAPKNSGQFCTTCGGAYQMVPPPSYENGGNCPHCKTPVPAGSARFCTHCGKNFHAGLGLGGGGGGGGGGMSNANLGAVGDIAGKFGFTVQRMVVLAVSVIGIIGALMPWTKYANEFMKDMLKAKGADPGILGTVAGVFAFLAFLLPIMMAVLGDRSQPITDKFRSFKVLCIVSASVSGLFSIGYFLFINAASKANMGWVGPGVGIWVTIAAAAAIGAIPFIRQLGE